MKKYEYTKVTGLLEKEESLLLEKGALGWEAYFVEYSSRRKENESEFTEYITIRFKREFDG